MRRLFLILLVAFLISCGKLNRVNYNAINFFRQINKLLIKIYHPIIRIYTEAPTQNEADVLAERFVNELKVIAGI